MAVCLGPQLSKLAARISEPFVKCLHDWTCWKLHNMQNPEE